MREEKEREGRESEKEREIAIMITLGELELVLQARNHMARHHLLLVFLIHCLLVGVLIAPLRSLQASFSIFLRLISYPTLISSMAREWALGRHVRGCFSQPMA